MRSQPDGKLDGCTIFSKASHVAVYLGYIFQLMDRMAEIGLSFLSKKREQRPLDGLGGGETEDVFGAVIPTLDHSIWSEAYDSVGRAAHHFSDLFQLSARPEKLVLVLFALDCFEDSDGDTDRGVFRSRDTTAFKRTGMRCVSLRTRSIEISFSKPRISKVGANCVS
jgi:hypothetical protein